MALIYKTSLLHILEYLVNTKNNAEMVRTENRLKFVHPLKVLEVIHPSLAEVEILNSP